MTEIAWYFCLATVALALIGTLLPTRLLGPVAALAGLAMISGFAPMAVAWLLCLIGLTYAAARLDARSGHRTPFTLFAAGIAAAALIFLRELETWAWVGAAYFTLRNIHVLLDCWMERYPAPSLRSLLIYNLFLPVIIVGPIHRYPNFERQLDRRRVSAEEISSGAERILFGLVQTIVLGGWVMSKVENDILPAQIPAVGFFPDWAFSALGWVDLYLVFAGLSSVAIGASAMMGLRIEENFNHPYAAKNLVDFWSRWHMSLTRWCREYVYQPVASATRLPVVGVLCAMLVLGIWHETSVYYLLWAVWQASGIVLSHLLGPYMPKLPGVLDAVARPCFVLAWLSCANPVVTRLEVML